MKTTLKIQSNFNKKVIGFGLCALMATSSVYAGEVASEPVSTENEIMLISTGETPINEIQEEVQAPHYASFEGVVTEIVHPYEDSETESQISSIFLLTEAKAMLLTLLFLKIPKSSVLLMQRSAIRSKAIT